MVMRPSDSWPCVTSKKTMWFVDDVLIVVVVVVTGIVGVVVAALEVGVGAVDPKFDILVL